MPCTDCLKNCDGSQTSDKCVQYTGPDIPSLGVCQGDSLYEVEATLLNSIASLLDGTGITLSDLTIDCTFISNLLGTDRSLPAIIQALITAACETKTDLDNLTAQVNQSFSISGDCLTLPSSPTLNDVLQAVVIKLCSLSTTVTGIGDDYVKASQLCSLVASCISGGSSSQEYLKMPKYVALPYHGPLSVFDSSGKGIAASGYDKVYLCNGQTVGTFTTPDYRGRSPIGANTNVPGGSLDSNVNPALPANSGYSIVAGTKKGVYTDTLAVSNLAPHIHTVTDPGHTHQYYTILFNGGGVGDGLATNHSHQDENNPNKTTGSATTGISVDSAGGGQPHNSTHPSMGTNFIMYIP